MAPQCNTGILWASNTPTVAAVHGCTTAAATFTPKAAATTAKHPVQRQTIPLASGSSRNCETFKVLNTLSCILQFSHYVLTSNYGFNRCNLAIKCGLIITSWEAYNNVMADAYKIVTYTLSTIAVDKMYGTVSRFSRNVFISL